MDLKCMISTDYIYDYLEYNKYKLTLIEFVALLMCGSTVSLEEKRKLVN